MTDPCDLPSSCRSNNLSGLGGVFAYNCSYLPPPTRFGINSYDLSLEFFDGNLTQSSYHVYLVNPRLLLLNFTVDVFAPYKFLGINNMNTDYIITLDKAENAIIIKKDGLIWRIGSFVQFTSCLVTEGYQLCNSLVTAPFTRPPEGGGRFTFGCGFLPPSSRSGFVTYDLIITYEENEQYNVRLIPTSSNGLSILAGTFRYDLLIKRFLVITSNPGYTLAVKDDNLVVYANTNLSPIWVLRGTDSGFRALINVPPGSNLGSGIPTPQPEVILPGCPTLFGNVWGTSDEKEICESRFVVTFFSKDRATEQRKEYVFYCTKVGAVLRGQGCTLGAKVDFLQKEGAEITVAGAATYGMLRLMLSLLLFKRFDLNLLRQEYYPDFLKKLKKSNFCAYEPLFKTSNYWQFFKQ